MFRSLQRTRGLARYFGKRARRLTPAYAVVVAVPTVAGLIIAMAHAAPATDFAAIGRYFAANIAFLNFLAPDLPGLFEGNRVATVNGALWTIKIEVMFYLVLPLIGIALGRAARWRFVVLAALYAGGEAWRAGFENAAAISADPIYAQMARQLPGQFSYFASGIAIALLWDRAHARPCAFALAGAALVALSLSPPLEFLRAAGIAGLVAGAAFAPPLSRSRPMLDAARYGDLSYGVYIVHFPIIQTIAALGLFAASPAIAILLALTTIGAASWLMWRFVEAPFLLADSRYARRRA